MRGENSQRGIKMPKSYVKPYTDIKRSTSSGWRKTEQTKEWEKKTGKYTCDNCNEAFDSEDAFKSHRMTQHAYTH